MNFLATPEQLEFGIEGLWCYQTCNADRVLSGHEGLLDDFSEHRWGTTLLVGAALAQFTIDREKNQKLLCVQLSQVAVEWSHETIMECFEFVKLLLPEAQSKPTVRKLGRGDSWSSVDTRSSPSGDDMASAWVIKIVARE